MISYRLPFPVGNIMKTILGIDPGASGALAFYDQSDLIIYDMPVHEITKGKSKRKRFDPYGMKAILEGNHCDHAFIEQVSAQPGNGASAAFTYGWMCAGIECCLAMAGIPFTYVTPQKWKKELSVPKDKDAARMRASQLLGDHAHNWPLRKHDGRAESSLIALYGMRSL